MRKQQVTMFVSMLLMAVAAVAAEAPSRLDRVNVTRDADAVRIEMKANSNDGKYINKQLPGRPKLAGSLTLTRGLTDDNSFEKWVKDAHFGKMSDARKGGAIIVYDYEGNALKRYKLTNAWPKSLEITTLKAGDTSVLSEKLVVTYETMEVE